MKKLLLSVLCIAGLNLCLIDTAIANKDRIHMAGTVTDAISGKPLQGVSVSTYYSSDITVTDEQGRFTLPNAPPGAETTVNATAYGFLDIAQPIPVASGKHTTLNLKMTPLPAKHPKLTGDWTLTLQLDDAKQKQRITGMILFNPGIRDSRLPEWRNTSDTAAVMTEFAEYHLDAEPFFGKDDWVNTHTEAEGYVTPENKVVINLPMNVKDAEIRLNGMLKNGVIRGTWMKMGYAPTHSGTFTLRKRGVMPLSVDEAVQDIVSKLPAADKKLIRTTESGKMGRFHHTLGTGIRDEYALWRGNDALLGNACKNVYRKLDDKGKPFLYCHPDEASAVILEAVWHKLQIQKKQGQTTNAPVESNPVIHALPPARHHGDDDARNYRFERYVLTPKSTWGHNEAARFLTDLQNSQTLEIKWNSPATLSVASHDGTTVKCNAAKASRQAVGDDFFLENYGVTLEALKLVSYKASAQPNLLLTTTDCPAQGFGRFIKAYGGWNVVLPVNGVLFIGVPN